MVNIYIPAMTTSLAPGVSFIHSLENKRICTVLKMCDGFLEYCVDQDEEVHQLAGEHIVLAVSDASIRRNQEQFLLGLTDRQAEMFGLLRLRRNRDHGWALGIQNFLVAPTIERFHNLLNNLSSQAKDNPEMAISMVGRRMTMLLLTHLS